MRTSVLQPNILQGTHCAVPYRQIGAQVMALSMFINLTLLDSNKQSLLDLHSLPIVTPLLRSTSVRRPPVRPPSHAHAHAHKRPRGANTAPPGKQPRRCAIVPTLRVARRCAPPCCG